MEGVIEGISVYSSLDAERDGVHVLDGRNEKSACRGIPRGAVRARNHDGRYPHEMAVPL